MTKIRTGSDFENAALNQSGGNLLVEYWQFIRQNKKWWMLPIVIMIALLGFLLVLSSTAAAPFIYTLF
jgi:drug/metabolite transporter superfamily protein YnfA